MFVSSLENLVLPDELKGSFVAVSPETTLKVYDLVKQAGFRIIEGGPYGFARMKALQKSVEENHDDYFFVCDFDKMLHWLNTDKSEFLGLFHKTYESDVYVVARSEYALASYPKAWVETEEIVSKIVEKIIGQYIDLMNGPYILNRTAAKVIADNAKETGVGSCTEWALLAFQHQLSITNLPVNGLTWEDPDIYQEAISDSENFEAWKNRAFDSLYEWRKRVEFLHKQVSVMIRLNEEPINPKFPHVKNKTFNS